MYPAWGPGYTHTFGGWAPALTGCSVVGCMWLWGGSENWGVDTPNLGSRLVLCRVASPSAHWTAAGSLLTARLRP